MTILTRLLLPARPPLSRAAGGADADRSSGNGRHRIQIDGTVRYSDKPPGNNSVVKKIHLLDRSLVTVPDSASLVEQMAATTTRLKEDLLEREKARQPEPRPQLVYYPQPEKNGITAHIPGPGVMTHRPMAATIAVARTRHGRRPICAAKGKRVAMQMKAPGMWPSVCLTSMRPDAESWE